MGAHQQTERPASGAGDRYQLATLFALYYLQERVGTYALQYGYLSPEQFELVRQQVRAVPSLTRRSAATER